MAGDKGDWGYVDNDLDIIDTGCGRDTVISGGTSPTADRISMGSRRSTLSTSHRHPTPEGSFDLGAGPNRLVIDLAGDPTSRLAGRRPDADTHAWRGRVDLARSCLDVLVHSASGTERPDLHRVRRTGDRRPRHEPGVVFGPSSSLGAGDDTVVERAPHYRNRSELRRRSGRGHPRHDRSDVGRWVGVPQGLGGPQPSPRRLRRAPARPAGRDPVRLRAGRGRGTLGERDRATTRTTSSPARPAPAT